MNEPSPARAREALAFVARPALVVAVVLSAVGVGHAASLGGVDSDDLASFTINGTVPTPPLTTTTTVPETSTTTTSTTTSTTTTSTTTSTTTTSTTTTSTTTATTTTTVPPSPTAVCGVGPTDVACVVPAGTTYMNNLDWDADVLVLGTVRNNLRVSGGTVTVGSGGIVGQNTTQSGPGGVIIAAGGINEGHVSESGPGSVTISGTVGRGASEGDAGDLVVTAGARIDKGVTATPTGICTISPIATVSGPRNGDCA